MAEEFRAGAWLIPYIVIGRLLFLASLLVQSYLLARKRTVSVTIARGCGAVAAVVLMIGLTIQFGILGAAITCPIVFAIQLLVMIQFARVGGSMLVASPEKATTPPSPADPTWASR